jgi:hypothetical protein
MKMACEKHKVRKRKDCPDCQAEQGVEEAPVKAKAKLVPSDIQVAAVGTLQDMETAIVIAEKLLEEPDVEVDLDEYRDFKNQELKKEVDVLVQKKLKEVEKEINRMLAIRHEALDIPLAKFNMKVMDSLLADGWKLIAFLTKDLAKLSGLKEDSVMMQRVKCDTWKKDLESYKLRFKE